MPYQRSPEIERRLDQLLRMIRTGRHSTFMPAQQMGVSIPTISQFITALRVKGRDIKAEKHGAGQRYVLRRPSAPRSPGLAGLAIEASN